jgi:RNA polymerase sigma factor for flagellar operon FliA
MSQMTLEREATPPVRAAAPRAEDHIGLVREIALRVCRTSGATADYEDLVGCGMVGLMRAISAFDPARGAVFSTYAAMRIKGEMLDELRRISVGTRGSWRRARTVRAARSSLQSEFKRKPTHRELATEMGVSGDTLSQWMDAASSVSVSLDDPASGGERGDSRPTLADRIPGAGAEGIEQPLEREQEAARLEIELARLPERERMVLVLHFMKEVKQRDIARLFGVTEGRVSQIRTAALARLRDRLALLRCE